MGGQVRNPNQGCFMEENSTQPAIAQRRFTMSALQGWGETLRMCLAQWGPTQAMAATKPRAARRLTTEKLNSPHAGFGHKKSKALTGNENIYRNVTAYPWPHSWDVGSPMPGLQQKAFSWTLAGKNNNNNNKSKFVSEKNRLQVFKSVSWLNLHKYSPSLPLIPSLSF